MRGCDETAQGAHGRAVGIEFIHGHAVFIIGAAEVWDFCVHRIDDLLIDRIAHAFLDFDVAGIGFQLPFIRQGLDQVASDELRPMSQVAIGSHEQAGTIAALLIDTRKPFSRRRSQPNPDRMDRYRSHHVLPAPSSNRLCDRP